MQTILTSLAFLCFLALPAEAQKVNLTSNVTGTLPQANGGTGVTGVPSINAAVANGCLYWSDPSGNGTLNANSGCTYDGTSKISLGVVGASAGAIQFNNATSGSVTLQPPTGALGSPTVILPIQSASIATGTTCGTIAANGACANTALNGTARIVSGIATLATGTSTVTALPFSATSSYFCVANDVTTSSNVVKMVPASATTATVTGTGTDNAAFICFGN